MDLKTYEQVKFELAEIIRAGELIAVSQVDDPNKRWQAEEPWRELLTRLAEDRFIPEIDVLILVTSYESPLTEDEIRFLRLESRVHTPTPVIV